MDIKVEIKTYQPANKVFFRLGDQFASEQYIEYTNEITKNNIISLTTADTIVSDNSKPQYGIVGQYGELIIKDVGFSFVKFYESHRQENYRVIIYYDGELYPQIYFIDTIETENESYNVTIKLVDVFDNFKQIPFRPLIPNNYTVIQLLNYAIDDLSKVVNVFSYFFIIEPYYNNTIMYSSLYFNKQYDNVYDLLSAICVAIHCSIKLTYNGIEVFSYE